MINIKNKIKAIIFDMDGTILDTESIWKKVIRDFLVQQGITYLTQEQKYLLKNNSGGGLLKSSQLMKKEFKFPQTEEEMVKQKVNLSLDYMKKYPVKFIEGFQDFHKKLQNLFISSGVATNANLKTLQVLNEKVKLSNFFGQNLYCLEHVGNKAKPDPTLFLHTAQKLNAQPSECIVFEDSISGFLAAKNAGIKCIAIKNKYNEKLLHHVDFAIETYHQAEEILKKI